LLIGSQPDDTAHKDPLTAKEALKILEDLYDLVLDIEQLRREQPNLDAEDTEVVDFRCASRSPILKYPRMSLTHFEECSVY
jgi:hypothetical protein